MPAAWFIIPLVDGPGPRPGVTLHRPAAVVNYLRQVRADGGRAEWAETGGKRVLAKVQASTATLNAIAAAAGVHRFPILDLEATLGSLTNQQRNTVRGWVQECGVTPPELVARFPDLATVKLRELLEFLGDRGPGRVSHIFGRVGDTTPAPTPRAPAARSSR